MDELVREKRALADELQIVKLKLHRCQKELWKSQSDVSRESVNAELDASRRTYSAVIESQEKEIQTLREKLEKKKRQLIECVKLDEIRVETQSFLRSCPEQDARFADIIEQVRGIEMTAMDAGQAVHTLFSALKSLVSRHEPDGTMSVRELESVSRSLSDKDQTIRKLEHDLRKTKSHVAKERERANSMEKQLKHEHGMIAKFARRMEASSHEVVESESFVKTEIASIEARITSLLNPIRKASRRHIRTDSDEDMITCLLSRVGEVDSLIVMMKQAFEMDEESADMREVVEELKDRLAAIPRIQAENERLEKENMSLATHCSEMESMVKRQAAELQKSRERQPLSQSERIVTMPLASSRTSDTMEMETKIRDLTSVVTGKEEIVVKMQKNNRKLKKKLTEIIIQKEEQEKKVSDLDRAQREQKSRYDDLLGTYSEVLQKLKESQRTVDELNRELHDNQLKIKDLQEDATYRYQTSLMSTRQQQYDALLKQLEAQESENSELDGKLAAAKIEISELQEKLESYNKENEALREARQEQLSVFAEMENRLSQTSQQYERVSSDFEGFQAIHFRTVEKLNKLKTKTAQLLQEHEDLASSYSKLEKETVPSCDLARYREESAAKDRVINQLKSSIAEQKQVLAKMEQQQSVLEQFREKFAREHERLKEKNGSLERLKSAIQKVHNVLNRLLSSASSVSPCIIELGNAMKPMFNEANLSLFSLDFIHSVSLSRLSFRVASIQPNPENDLLTTDDRQVMNEIYKRLLSFPISRSRVMAMNPFSSVTEKLKVILGLADLVKELFGKNEESMSQLSSLVASQHSAILQMATG